tara:strand:- start:216 stop:368 length:153 start_codon:yes stop_codon:yes gene_type:complete
MNVEDWGRVTGYWVEGIATGLVVSIIPLFVMGLAVGVGVKVFTLPIRRFE